MYVTSIANIEFLKKHNTFSFEQNQVKKIDDVLFITNKPKQLKNNNSLLKHQHSPMFHMKEDDFFLIDEEEFNSHGYEKIDLRNDFDKILISSCYLGFGHFILDTIGLIFQSIENVKNPLIVININNYLNARWFHEKNEYALDFLVFLKKCLKKYDIPYIFLKNEYAIAINNFYHVTWMDHSDFLYNKIYEVSQSFVKNNNKKQKKVYIQSKSNINVLKIHEFNSYKLAESRIFNENYLEDFLKENNFEVVDTLNNFESIEEQIQYFNNVKTIMSTTSSGLVNSLFMKPGSNVIELMSPMIDVGKPYYVLHSAQYQDMAYSRGHNYFAKKNLIDGKLIVEDIKNNSKFLEMIK